MSAVTTESSRTPCPPPTPVGFHAQAHSPGRAFGNDARGSSLIDLIAIWGFPVRVVFDVLDELDLAPHVTVSEGRRRFRFWEDDNPVVWDGPSAVRVDV